MSSFASLSLSKSVSQRVWAVDTQAHGLRTFVAGKIIQSSRISSLWSAIIVFSHLSLAILVSRRLLIQSCGHTSCQGGDIFPFDFASVIGPMEDKFMIPWASLGVPDLEASTQLGGG